MAIAVCEVAVKTQGQVFFQRQYIGATMFGVTSLDADSRRVAVEVKRMDRQAGKLLSPQTRKGCRPVEHGPVATGNASELSLASGQSFAVTNTTDTNASNQSSGL
jgi:hypothetical protein